MIGATHMDSVPAPSHGSIPAEISRSWLLVPGTAADRFERAQRSRADQIILDVEDAVDPAAKPGARATVGLVAGGRRRGLGAHQRSHDRLLGRRR